MKADLHCHSRVSDGSLSIPDLVTLASRLGIGALAITDHDTVDGMAEAENAGRRYGVEIIPGVEISAFDYKRKRKAHILGYLPEDPQKIGEACRPMLRRRQENSQWIVETLRKAGYPLTWEFVERIAADSTNVYKQHIMHSLLELGYSSGIKDDLYRKLFAKPNNGNPGGLAYKEIEYMDAREAVRLIKEAGGVAVLAHPSGYGNMDLIPELLDSGLDGLEAWHPSHDNESVKLILSLAVKHGLLVTGGSDFHGMYEGKPNPLGNCYTPDEWLQHLYRLKN